MEKRNFSRILEARWMKEKEWKTKGHKNKNMSMRNNLFENFHATRSLSPARVHRPTFSCLTEYKKLHDFGWLNNQTEAHILTKEIFFFFFIFFLPFSIHPSHAKKYKKKVKFLIKNRKKRKIHFHLSDYLAIVNVIKILWFFSSLFFLTLLWMSLNIQAT